MKTFSATEARNRFGEFLDAGIVEGVKLVRNNRVLGYFLPEREYTELKRASMLDQGRLQRPQSLLSQAQEESLALYSQGKIGSSEAKVELHCDRRELIALLAERGLELPHIDLARAIPMADETLVLLGVNHG